MKNIIQEFDQGILYDLYEFILDANDEDISSEDIIKHLQTFFLENLDYAFSFLPFNSYLRLSNMASNLSEYQVSDRFEIDEIESIVELIFLEDIKENNGRYEYKLIPIFKEKLANNEDLKTQKYMEAVMQGMIEVYGHANLDYINSPVELILAEDDYLIHDLKDSVGFINYLLYMEYDMHHNTILHPSFDLDEMDIVSPRILYEKELYLDFAMYNLPKQVILSYIELDDSSLDPSDYDLKAYELHGQVQSLKDPYTHLYHLASDDKIDLQEYESLFNWPIWRLGGMSFFVYLNAMLEEGADTSEDYQRVEDNLIISAITRSNLILEEDTNIEDVFDSIKAYIEDEEVYGDFIKQIKKDYPHLPEAELNALENLIIIENGEAIHLEKGILSIYHDDNIYHVKSNKRLIEDSIDPASIPAYVNCILVPLEDNMTHLFSILKTKKVYLDEETDKFEYAKDVYSYQDIDPKMYN